MTPIGSRRYLSLGIGVLGTGLLLLMLCSFINPTRPKVVCFGDSITHGALVDGHSWVWYLNHDHQTYDFINEGRNGRKTSDTSELLPVLQAYPHAAYYMLFLGVNDLKDGTPALVQQCVDHMQWMIDQIRAVDGSARIILLSPSDISLGHMSVLNQQKKYNEHTHESLQTLEHAYRKLARNNHLRFISLLHVVSPSNYVDGLHPNPMGQQQIAAAVWKGWKGQ